jgi:hypothetical protein
LRASGPQPPQGIVVDTGQDPPGGRIGGDRPEQRRLVTQHRQVRDRLAAVGEQHRHVGGDPAGVMAALALP